MTMNIMLMRSAEASDPYHDALSKLGTVTSISALAFEFINLDELKIELCSPERWSGIVFTSKRAVQATKQCTISGSDMSSWRQKRCYVVGEATSEEASLLGFNCVGRDCGNASNLGKLIVDDLSQDQSRCLLFVCGTMRKDTLPKLLHDNKVMFKETVVYKTIADSNLQTSIEQHIKKHSVPTHIVYFSPSGYAFSNDLWKTALSNVYSDVQLVAIGPTTLSEMVATNKPIISANKPNPSSLFNAISQCIS